MPTQAMDCKMTHCPPIANKFRLAAPCRIGDQLGDESYSVCLAQLDKHIPGTGATLGFRIPCGSWSKERPTLPRRRLLKPWNLCAAPIGNPFTPSSVGRERARTTPKT